MSRRVCRPVVQPLADCPQGPACYCDDQEESLANSTEGNKYLVTDDYVCANGIPPGRGTRKNPDHGRLTVF